MPIADHYIVIIDFSKIIPITSYSDKYNRKYYICYKEFLGEVFEFTK